MEESKAMIPANQNKHRRYKEPIKTCSSLTTGGLVLNEKEIFLCFALLTALHYHPMRSALDWLTLKNLQKPFSLFTEYDVLTMTVFS